MQTSIKRCGLKFSLNRICLQNSLGGGGGGGAGPFLARSLLLLSNSKAPSNGKRYLLTSYNVDDVSERAPGDDENVMLMAQEAKQDFILHFTT